MGAESLHFWAVLGPRAEISRFWACSCSAAGGVETKAATAPFSRICTICPVKDAVVGGEITNVLISSDMSVIRLLFMVDFEAPGYVISSS